MNIVYWTDNYALPKDSVYGDVTIVGAGEKSLPEGYFWDDRSDLV
ncbi:MAG: hypothetical protein R3B44_08640 [Candidatus Brocadiaceae bacterium]